MIVPLAKALSRIFWSAALFFSISAHCARGTAQLPTYEYIGGFSLTSEFCANTGAPVRIATANAHTAASAYFFMDLSLFAKVPKILSLESLFLGRASVAPLICFSGGRYRIFELRRGASASDTGKAMLYTSLQKMAVCCCCICRVSSGDGVQSS